MLRYQYSEDNEFGIRLREARKASGLTLQRCAELLNAEFGMSINKGTISKYENGIHEPSASMVHCLSEILVVSRNYLLGKDDDPLSTGSLKDLIHFRVRDDSMAPKYRIDDLLVVRKNIVCKSGMCCLVRMPSGQRIVRKYLQGRQSHKLVPENSSFMPLKLKPEELSWHYCENCYSIIGVVVELRRPEIFT